MPILRSHFEGGGNNKGKKNNNIYIFGSFMLK